jgi:arylsulfatase A-like enzyme
MPMSDGSCTPGFSRRSLLQAGAVGLAANAAASPLNAAPRPAAGERPNILWFVSEDNTAVIGAYGDTLAFTPNIDRLASRGILFERAYCTSPVCGPSRFSLLTGMYPTGGGNAEEFGSTDEVLPLHIRGYPAYFKDLGYYTTNNAKKNYNSQFDNVLGMWDESSNQAHWRNRAANQPFFSVFNSMTTHESCLFNPRPGIGDRVKPEMIRIPAYLPDAPGVRKDWATFYNAMELMDGELGRKLDDLEKDGLADDTIIFHYSDNGGITMRGKRYCYEMGTRCSLIIYVPPKWAHLSPYAPGSRVSDPVSFADLMPTVLSLVDIPTPPHVHGRALLGPHRAPARKYAFSGRDRMDERYDVVRSVSDGRYRYIRNYSPHRPYGQHVTFMFQAAGYQDWEAAWIAGTLNEAQSHFWKEKPFEELYDLQADPDQIRSLAGDPAHKAKLAELRKAVDDQIVKTNDNGFIPEGCALRGYSASRAPGAYPLQAIKALADRAASRDAGAIAEFVKALDHDHEVVRYWGAQGLLIAGEAARPHVARLKTVFLNDPSTSVRIPLAELLVALTDDHDALRGLGFTLENAEDSAFRIQAINALTYVGDKAKPVLPAIRRAGEEDDRNVRKAAEYLIRVLEGRYDPKVQPRSPGGGASNDPEKDTGPVTAGRG